MEIKLIIEILSEEISNSWFDNIKYTYSKRVNKYKTWYGFVYMLQLSAVNWRVQHTVKGTFYKVYTYGYTQQNM